jgi:hypothetical protein
MRHRARELLVGQRTKLLPQGGSSTSKEYNFIIDCHNTALWLSKYFLY